MRNRAKCKLCGYIIESKHMHDYVECKCGAIAVDGGSDYFRAVANEWENFLRIDDEDNEIPIKVVEKGEQETKQDVKQLETPLTKEEKLKALDEMIKSYENLPPHALSQPTTHYDILSVLLLVKSLLSD